VATETPRAEAKRLDALHYWTGKACKNGHVDHRFTSTGGCMACCREASLRFHYRHHEQQTERCRAWKKANPDAVRANRRQWYYDNREKSLASVLDYQSRNQSKVRAWKRTWHYQHPEKSLTLVRNRRARLKGVEGHHTAQDIAAIFKAQKGRCAYCRSKLGKRFHRDHIVAVTQGGTNWRRNIQLTCDYCNVSKGSKDPIAYAQKRGLLL
jgi:hypothetical protein